MMLTSSTASIGVGGFQDLTPYFRDAAGKITAIDGIVGLNYAASE